MTTLDDSCSRLSVHLLDYGKGDPRFMTVPVPTSPTGVAGTVAPTSGWGWDEMADPLHQQFRAVAALSPKDRNRFSSHILPDGNMRAVSENITLRVPGSPLFLPRQLKRAYLPMIREAMDDYAQQFDINRAVIALQVRMGMLEPARDADRTSAPLHGTGLRDGMSTKMWRSHFSATYPHIDGGSVEDLDAGEINPTNRWYICFNRHAPVGVTGIGLTPAPDKRDEAYIKSLPQQVPAENQMMPNPYTVIAVDPLAVHWGRNADTRMFRHFASVRLFHPEDALDVETLAVLPGFHNRRLTAWYGENRQVVDKTLSR